MVATATLSVADLVRRAAHPLTDAAASLDPLMEVIGDARFALIGEASHGTHEFYDVRARLTRRLIEEKGFAAVAVEADWPDAYRVNRYVRGRSPSDALPEDALGDFRRFPLWMWRNTVVLDFVGWLRAHNRELDYRDRVGFYGVDLYSLYGSIQAVIRYLDGVDPDAAKRARERYACFEHYDDDPQRYGYAMSRGWGEGCEDQVVQQLVELRSKMRDYLNRDGFVAEDEAFFAQQNALLVQNAERYYRQMFGGRVSTWNLRDTHMADTVDALADHLARQGRPAKIVIWAHNSHLGDARATSMSDIGELNLGQLMRERHGGGETRIVGFTTYDGEVTAADDWDGPARRKRVRPGLSESVEALFHETGQERFILDLREDAEVAEALRTPLLERAIGVIYHPRTERASHYFDTRVSDQFDAVIHLDRTTALKPLDPTSAWRTGEEETYPFGV